MNLDINHLGFAAAVCTTSAFVPQVLMVWRQRGWWVAIAVAAATHALQNFLPALTVAFG